MKFFKAFVLFFFGFSNLNADEISDQDMEEFFSSEWLQYRDYQRTIVTLLTRDFRVKSKCVISLMIFREPKKSILDQIDNIDVTLKRENYKAKIFSSLVDEGFDILKEGTSYYPSSDEVDLRKKVYLSLFYTENYLNFSYHNYRREHKIVNNELKGNNQFYKEVYNRNNCNEILGFDLGG